MYIRDVNVNTGNQIQLFKYVLLGGKSLEFKILIFYFRLECIDKIKQREADFGTVDPEDMLVASKVPNQDFAIFEEIRTREEPEGK